MHNAYYCTPNNFKEGSIAIPSKQSNKVGNIYVAKDFFRNEKYSQ